MPSFFAACCRLLKVCVSCLACIQPSCGRGAQMLSVSPGEGRIAAPSAAVAGFRGPHTGVHQLPGFYQSLLGDVQVNGGLFDILFRVC